MCSATSGSVVPFPRPCLAVAGELAEVRSRDGDYSVPLEMSRRLPATAEAERMSAEFAQSFWTCRG
jgi:hypothetical protein